MATEDSEGRELLEGWLALLDGPGYKGRVARDRAVAEMRAAGADRLFPLLVPMLTGPDPKARCKACEAVLRVDADRAIELVLPLLDDPDASVRWHACGCLHDFVDERAVAPLVRVLQGDQDPQVRGAAAYALGGIRSLAAIPALLEAMELDHELDILNYSPSSGAAGALDDILGTNVTRGQPSQGMCKTREQPTTLEGFKRVAREAYQGWLKRQAGQGAASGGGE